MADNCITATQRLLQLLQVKFSNRFIEDSILSHPDHPSLLSIVDTLEKFKIESYAINITKEKLNKLFLPCIVQISSHGTTWFCALQMVEKDEVTFYNHENQKVKKSIEDFKKIWTGVCLLVQKTGATGEVGINKKIKSRRFTKLLFGALSLFLIFWLIISLQDRGELAKNLFLFGSFMFLKLIGLIVSVALLWYDVDKYNPRLQSICSGEKKINCDLVLNSNYSRFLGEGISLSSISFSYFFASILFLLIVSFSDSSFAFLSHLSLLTIPFIFFSIYAQGFLIKRWCKFCIIVQTILILEVITAVSTSTSIYVISLKDIPIFLVFYLTGILGWKLLKPLLNKEKELNIYKRGLRKLKNNKSVLLGLLANSRKITSDTKNLGINFQNKTSKFQVLKICNPYCGPCAKAHPILEGLYKKGHIDLQVIFTALPDKKDPRSRPVSHLLAIDSQGDKNKTQESLGWWYKSEKKDYGEFSKIFPMNDRLEQQYEKIRDMNEWCKNEKISHTPTIFINGFELPKEYSVEDLQEVLN